MVTNRIHQSPQKYVVSSDTTVGVAAHTEQFILRKIDDKADIPELVSPDVLIIIQARMSSSRLPNKVLCPLINNISVLEFMLNRVKKSRMKDRIVVATSSREEDDAIAKLCKRQAVRCFRGSLNDVLSRYYYIAHSPQDGFPSTELFGSLDDYNLVVRLTADCPLIDPILLDRMIQYSKMKLNWLNASLQGNYTFQYFLTNAGCNRSYPVGMDIEIMTLKTLDWLFAIASTPEEKEHVTTLLYNESPSTNPLYTTPFSSPNNIAINPGLRSRELVCGNYANNMEYHLVTAENEINMSYRHYKWAIDTIEDLNHVRELVQWLYNNDKEDFTFEDICLAEAT